MRSIFRMNLSTCLPFLLVLLRGIGGTPCRVAMLVNHGERWEYRDDLAQMILCDGSEGQKLGLSWVIIYGLW